MKPDERTNEEIIKQKLDQEEQDRRWRLTFGEKLFPTAKDYIDFLKAQIAISLSKENRLRSRREMLEQEKRLAEINEKARREAKKFVAYATGKSNDSNFKSDK